MINKKHIEMLSAPLYEILMNELDLGNKIYETSVGPLFVKHGLFILLEKPFLTAIKTDICGIKFREVNDPHYWKSEYHDEKLHHVLACCFEKV